MIASLTGVLKAKDDRSCIVEVGGVGFKLVVSATTAASLPDVGEKAVFFTAMHFRDREGFELFGFIEERERRLFDLLIEVQGVGPRGALTILSAATVDEIEQAIATDDEQLLMRVSGIGRKKAQKILLELKERYEGLALIVGGETQDTVELLDALKDLGYSEREVREVVRKLPRELSTTEERMREALKRLGRHT